MQMTTKNTSVQSQQLLAVPPKLIQNLFFPIEATNRMYDCIPIWDQKEVLYIDRRRNYKNLTMVQHLLFQLDQFCNLFEFWDLRSYMHHPQWVGGHKPTQWWLRI